MKELPVARMALIFCLLYLFSFHGVFAAWLGYGFFHAKNPNGVQGILFLIFGGASLFFGVHLLRAFTDPLPAWLDYWLTPAHRAPMTDRQKRTLFILNAFWYVAMMAVLVFIIMGDRLGLSLERIALPLGIGLLAILLLFFLLDIIHAIYVFQKDRKTPDPPNLNAKSR
ncbi:MAG TPA: hypothetical protein VJL88_08150 [Nitrospira sp.]|nr:hypothetical protein [Nitrospira sp.]